MREFEREFLKQAIVWIRCRYRVINGDVLIGCKIPFEISYDMLGCLDSEAELKLLCQEMRYDAHARE